MKKILKKQTGIKGIIAWGILLLIAACSNPATNSEPKTTAATSEKMEKEAVMTFDSLRAQKLGADDYGMKTYVMAFLKRGPNREIDEKKAAELQSAHMKNISRLAEAGKLVLAGPFLGDGDLRGIYIFDVKTIAEAEALTNTDPAIQSGSLVMELQEWYGSAALMEVGDIHEVIAKVKF